MKIKFSKKFKKQLKKSPREIQNSFKNRFKIFSENPNNPILRNHGLKHKWQGHRSIDVTGNWRAIFYETNDEWIVFRTIDTHSNLYK
jgi:addiction module RelE/StbE family toxin|tara:strand:- start:19 stop:279 length:261 start_codon:yes stop_codon:yes gene_type:complete